MRVHDGLGSFEELRQPPHHRGRKAIAQFERGTNDGEQFRTRDATVQLHGGGKQQVRMRLMGKTEGPRLRLNRNLLNFASFWSRCRIEKKHKTRWPRHLRPFQA